MASRFQPKITDSWYRRSAEVGWCLVALGVVTMRYWSAWSRHLPPNDNDRGVYDKCSDDGGVRRRNRADTVGGQSAATETSRERECSMPGRQPDDASQSTQQRRLCPAPAYTLPMRTPTSPRATEPTRCLLIGGPSLSAPLAITRAIPPASPVLADYPLGLVPHFAHPSSHVDPLRQVDRSRAHDPRAHTSAVRIGRGSHP